jgi:cytochrome c556
MKRGRRPHYPLTAIKAAFADLHRLNRTMAARDFEKSMPSEADPAIWQDVYKPIVGGRELYAKFTLDARGEL